MALVNITGSRVVEDPTYRYKMPKLAARTEGRGNGIHTLIINMNQIADAINRPPDVITKYFGVELGAQTRWEEENTKSTVNGAHTAPDLQQKLNTFIDKFVLCPACLLPETSLVINTKGTIKHSCNACGHKGPVDMSHKLCTYILKQAEQELSKAKAARADQNGGKVDKKEKREKKDKKDKSDKISSSSNVVSDKAAVVQASVPDESSSDDDDYRGTSSVAASIAAQRAASVANSNASTVTSNAAQTAIEKLLLTPKDATACKNVALAVKGMKQTDILRNFTNAALAGGDTFPHLKGVPIALSTLYEADILDDEDTVLAWGTTVDERVRTKAQPFLTWLATADEEDDDEDEE